MNELNEFVNYLSELQIPLKKEIDIVEERIREREKSCMSTYGCETPKYRGTLFQNNVIDNLKKLASKSNSLEELENTVRNSQIEVENKQINYAIEVIEGFKNLDLSSNNRSNHL